MPVLTWKTIMITREPFYLEAAAIFPGIFSKETAVNTEHDDDLTSAQASEPLVVDNVVPEEPPAPEPVKRVVPPPPGKVWVPMDTSWALGNVQMLFSSNPWDHGSIGVMLCQTEFVVRGNRIEPVPTKMVTRVELENIRPGDERPSFRVHRLELQALANELARVGIYPDNVPQPTAGHIDDLRHSRDKLEDMLSALIGKLDLSAEKLDL